MIPFIDVHTHHAPSNKVLYLINQPLDQPAHALMSIGIHPWEIDNIDTESAILTIKNNLTNKYLLAIGECGIDRAIKTPVETQLNCFIKQADIAESQSLPVIIHCVKAWSDFLQIRKKYCQPWIFHGFNGNTNIALSLLEQGCFLSFGQSLLKSAKIQAVFCAIPLQNIFLETDDDPSINIEEIYQFAAKLRHICTDELKKKIFTNFKMVFSRYADGLA